MIGRAARAALAAGARLAGAGCAGAQGAAAGAPAARARVDTAALRATLDSIAGAHRGVMGYVVRDIDAGVSLARRADETFPTASMVKVPILVTVHDLVAKGRLSLDDPLTVLPIDKVGGSGVLQFLHDGMAITVGDAAWLMIGLSDNTATNLLLDRIVIRRVWEKMEALGLPHTKVHSKSFLRSSSVAMDSSVKYGLGVTTPGEMARLFELLAQGRAVSPAADSAMLATLEQSQYDRMLLRFAPGVRVAHKGGQVDASRSECGLFHLRSRVVVCVLTKENANTSWQLDNEAEIAGGRIAEAVVRAWGVPEAAKP